MLVTFAVLNLKTLVPKLTESLQ